MIWERFASALRQYSWFVHSHHPVANVQTWTGEWRMAISSTIFLVMGLVLRYVSKTNSESQVD